jgi:hypothetical protein
MTKYEEMLSWSEAAHAERGKYEREATAFATCLVDGLKEYLGCDRNCLVISPAPGNPHFPLDPGKDIAFPGAMHMGEAGYWRFRCSILQRRPLPETKHVQVFPYFPIVTFIFKKDKDWEVATTHFDDKFRFPATGCEAKDMRALFDRLVRAIREGRGQSTDVAMMLKDFFPPPDVIGTLSPQEIGERLLFFFEDLILK